MSLAKKIGAVAVIALGLATATTGSAQTSYYFGGGLVYSMASSTFSVTAPNEGDLYGLGLTYGMRVDSGSYFYGGEVDADINVGGELRLLGTGPACSEGFASNAYYCSQTATMRLRGIFGTNMGGFDVFGSLGYGIIYGEGAIGPSGVSATAVSGGFTYGIGAQMPMAGGTMRFEIIQDEFTQSISQACCDSAPEWSATSAKVSYLWTF